MEFTQIIGAVADLGTLGMSLTVSFMLYKALKEKDKALDTSHKARISDAKTTSVLITKLVIGKSHDALRKRSNDSDSSDEPDS